MGTMFSKLTLLTAGILLCDAFAAAQTGASITPRVQNIMLQQIAGTMAGNASFRTPSSNSELVVGRAGAQYSTIQDALNAVTTSRNVVRVTPGTYNMTAPLRWPSVPVNLQCDSPATTVLSWTSISTYAINAPLGGSRIANCFFEGHGVSAMAINAGFNVWQPSTRYKAGATVVPTVSKGNGHWYAQTAASCTSGGSEPSWPIAAIGTVSNGSCIFQEAGPTKTIVENNVFGHWSGTQILNTGGYNYGWLIRGNTFRDSSGEAEAILVGGGSQAMVIEDNTCDNVATDCIDLNGSHNKVIGNIMHDVGRPGGPTDRSCVLINGTDGFAASDNEVGSNICVHSGAQAFMVEANAGSSASRNIFHENTSTQPGGTGGNGDCFDVGGNTAGTLDQNTLVDNHCIDPQRSGYNINTSDRAVISNTRLIGNNSTGAAAYDLVLYGTEATILLANQWLTSGKEVSNHDAKDPTQVNLATVCASGTSTCPANNVGGLSIDKSIEITSESHFDSIEHDEPNPILMEGRVR
jgi:hypothetical protein